MKILGKILCNIINYGFFGAVVAAISFLAGMIVNTIMAIDPKKDYGYFTALCRFDGHKVIVKEAKEICKCDEFSSQNNL